MVVLYKVKCDYNRELGIGILVFVVSVLICYI